MPTVLDEILATKRREVAAARGRVPDAELERAVAGLPPARGFGARLAALHREAVELGLDVLVELHDADQLPRVLDCGATLVGINNRDLRTFRTRLEHTLDLMPRIPAGVAVVSESGVRTHDDLVRLAAAGVRAVLVGESLM